MIYKLFFILFIIASLLIIVFVTTRLQFAETFKNKTYTKVVDCQGCLDEELKCHPGTNPVCSNKSQTLCYAFYDENGNKRTPCGLYDTFDDVEESCNNCQTYCQYCIGPDGVGRCIGRDLFNCTNCPGSRLCRENTFDIYIPDNSKQKNLFNCESCPGSGVCKSNIKKSNNLLND